MLASDLKPYRSQIISNDNTNGGRINDAASALIASGVEGNLLPSRDSDYLAAGGEIRRKFFFRNEEPNGEQANSVRVWLDRPTLAGDWATLVLGTDTDTEADLGALVRYGAGYLNFSVSAGAIQVRVWVESTTTIFRTGDLVRISDGTNTEFVTLTGASLLADEWTLDFSGDALANGYSATDNATVVSSVIEVGDKPAEIYNSAVTSASGTFSTAQVTVTNWSIPDDITITFTDATSFTGAGLVAGDLGPGVIGGEYDVANPNTNGENYFVIASAAWGGTYQAGDTVVFSVRAPVWAIWVMLQTPAGMSALNPNTVGVRGDAQAAVV